MIHLLGCRWDESFGRAFALPHAKECRRAARRRTLVSDEGQDFGIEARWGLTNGGPTRARWRWLRLTGSTSLLIGIAAFSRLFPDRVYTDPRYRSLLERMRLA
jgi:hypothetical protein